MRLVILKADTNILHKRNKIIGKLNCQQAAEQESLLLVKDDEIALYKDRGRRKLVHCLEKPMILALEFLFYATPSLHILIIKTGDAIPSNIPFNCTLKRKGLTHLLIYF